MPVELRYLCHGTDHGIVLKRADPVEMYAVVMTGIVAENGG